MTNPNETIKAFAETIECDLISETDGATFAIGETVQGIPVFFFVAYLDGATWRICETNRGEEIPQLSKALARRFAALLRPARCTGSLPQGMRAWGVTSEAP